MASQDDTLAGYDWQPSDRFDDDLDRDEDFSGLDISSDDFIDLDDYSSYHPPDSSKYSNGQHARSNALLPASEPPLLTPPSRFQLQQNQSIPAHAGRGHLQQPQDQEQSRGDHFVQQAPNYLVHSPAQHEREPVLVDQHLTAIDTAPVAPVLALVALLHPLAMPTALQTSDTKNSASKKSRSRTGVPRTRCGCAFGCRVNFYMRSKMPNVQCAPCSANKSGRCSEPVAGTTQTAQAPASADALTYSPAVYAPPATGPSSFAPQMHHAPAMSRDTSAPLPQHGASYPMQTGDGISGFYMSPPPAQRQGRIPSPFGPRMAHPAAAPAAAYHVDHGTTRFEDGDYQRHESAVQNETSTRGAAHSKAEFERRMHADCAALLASQNTWAREAAQTAQADHKSHIPGPAQFSYSPMSAAVTGTKLADTSKRRSRKPQQQATAPQPSTCVEASDDEAVVNAHLEGKAQVEYTLLQIADDDVDSVTDDQRRDLCKQVFNALLDDRAAAPAGLNNEEKATYTKRQTDALKQCKSRLKSPYDSKHASACSDKLFYTAVRLHEEGIPKHPLSPHEKTIRQGYRLDKISKFTIRFAAVIAAVSGNKRVAYDVLRGRRLGDLTRWPQSFLRRKVDNCVENGKKGEMLRAAKGKVEVEGTGQEAVEQEARGAGGR